MLVTREQPSFQAPFEGHIVLLCTKVIRQRVPDCRTLHSECSAANSGEPCRGTTISWCVADLSDFSESLPACNIGDRFAHPLVKTIVTSVTFRWISRTDNYASSLRWVTRIRNKWSKNFDERPHRSGRWIFHMRNVNATPASREQCSWLQQSHWCRCWHFCCVHRSSDSKCISVGRTTPKHCPFPLRISTPSDTWFLESTRVKRPNGISIGSAVLLGSRTWPTDRHTSYEATGRI